MNRIEELFNVIDVDWVRDNPEEAFLLIQLGKKELDNRKDVIEKQRNKELLLRAIIEDNKTN